MLSLSLPVRYRKLIFIGLVLLAVGVYLYYRRSPKVYTPVAGNPAGGPKSKNDPALEITYESPEADGRADSNFTGEAPVAGNPVAGNPVAGNLESEKTTGRRVHGGHSAVFPLKKGSSGEQVRQLQTYILKEFGGMEADNINGHFDAHTEHMLHTHLNRKTMSEKNFYKRSIHLIN
ncbi:MAG: hypothetical protein WBA17_15215 [Saprospiraceae bacterium]